MADRQRKKLNIRRTVSAESISTCDVQAAEAILAKMVARAYAADHPELINQCTKSLQLQPKFPAESTDGKDSVGVACPKLDAKLRDTYTI